MLLKILSFYQPMFVKKRKMRELFQLTADAFQCETPKLTGLSLQELLLNYALFTKEQAEISIERGDDLNPIKSRLYQNARQLGSNIKKSLHIATLEEALLASRIIYGILAIDFHGDLQGKILIRRCFFSNFYSGAVCRIISSLDEGLLTGLSDGSLQFKQRITEGHNCCMAQLEMRKVLE